MVQVKDILKMEILKNFHIVAGRQGLDREVLVTTILEYEQIGRASCRERV